MINLVEKEWQEHQKVAEESEILKGQIAKVGELLCECLKKRWKNFNLWKWWKCCGFSTFCSGA